MCCKQVIYLKTSFTENVITDLTGGLLYVSATTLDLPSGKVLCWFLPFIHNQLRPPSQVLYNSLNCLLLYKFPGGSILFSGVKQIQNKLVGKFSHFTSSQKTEVAKAQYKMNFCAFWGVTESVNWEKP